jgi:hypothetical protein
MQKGQIARVSGLDECKNATETLKSNNILVLSIP